MKPIKINIAELTKFIKEIVNEELKVASDGGYYDAPEHKIIVTQKEADYINNIAKSLYNDLFTPDYTTVVDKGDELKMEMINKLRANIKMEYDTDVSHDDENGHATGAYNYFWINPDEDMELAKTEFKAMVDSLYDKIQG